MGEQEQEQERLLQPGGGNALFERDCDWGVSESGDLGLLRLGPGVNVQAVPKLSLKGE
jgi:hypothetical protein